jgi:hypothetical protein
MSMLKGGVTMRKPLLLMSMVCCLLLSATTPLLSAVEWQDSVTDSAAGWSLGSWFAARIPGLPLLANPMFVNIFNDGPDPVESGEPEEDESAEEPPAPDDSDCGPKPLNGANTNIPGSRE